jgi:diamine N-acetyltransferase
MRIEGEKTYLRPITEDDTDLIVDWRNREDVIKYFIIRDPFTKEGHEKWLKTRVFTGEVVQFIVNLKEDDRPVGCTYIRDIDTLNRKAEYGVFIGESEVRGRGIGKEILNLTTDYAFRELDLHRVYARVLDYNAASYNCFLSCGYKEEGVLKDSLFLDGEYHDLIILGKLNPGDDTDGK